jgi:formylglycine-generating enzyme required for sulfatase activity
LLFPFTLTPVDCGAPEDLLVDAFEVTRGEWESALSSKRLDPQASQARDLFWSEPAPNLPATGMTLSEAQAFAGHEGMRLPTAKEWVRIAAGRRGQEYPWTTVSHASVANTAELGLGRLAAVGTFHAGRTPSGVHDLCGNASEWVTAVEGLSAGVPKGPGTWVMGGSFLSRQRATYAFDSNARGGVSYNAIQLDPGHRGADVGFRIVANAEDWLRKRAPLWSTDGAGLERLRRVGRKWGPGAISLLERLAQETESGTAFEALLEGARE